MSAFTFRVCHVPQARLVRRIRVIRARGAVTRVLSFVTTTILARLIRVEDPDVCIHRGRRIKSTLCALRRHASLLLAQPVVTTRRILRRFARRTLVFQILARVQSILFASGPFALTGKRRIRDSAVSRLRTGRRERSVRQGSMGLRHGTAGCNRRSRVLQIRCARHIAVMLPSPNATPRISGRFVLVLTCVVMGFAR
jgi:hypothetical protein